MPITDTQVVRFSNERARTVADELTALDYVLAGWQADYAAQGIASKISAAGPTELVADGSDVDGRPRVSGTQILNLHAAINQVRTALSTTLVSGVGATAKAIADGIQVNGAPR